MKLWIVTAVDCGDTCDGKARVLATCKTRDEAEAYVEEDIKQWADDRAGENIEVDFNKMSAYSDTCDGCEWNIQEIDLT